MITVTPNKDESRIQYLVRVLSVFIEDNGVGMMDYENVIFDEAECDMNCLLDDMKIELGMDTL